MFGFGGSTTCASFMFYMIAHNGAQITDEELESFIEVV
jgi:hypothetical protein